ncbi:MAG: DUF6544 family protein [Candidatus Pelethousia sp.]|nr:DUF6544 family protein [Candidatus Pelethousia sp.]
MMGKRERKKMWIVAAGVILIFVGVAVFFRIPFSPTKAQFKRMVLGSVETAAVPSAIFTEADIERLPIPVQRYFLYCRYLGTSKMAYMKACLRDVDFVMSASRTVKIDYTQFNLVERPVRYAQISSSLFSIPFEGLDFYRNGVGSMKGTLAKIIPLFDQRGEDMNRACLVTWLAECLMVPHAALQDFVKWEPIDDTHAKASILWKGISASGVFAFSKAGELLAFRTADRVAVDMEGKERKAEWSAYFRAYHPINGVLQPKIIQSVWHYPEGDCVYFNQNEAAVVIQYH